MTYTVDCIFSVLHQIADHPSYQTSTLKSLGPFKSYENVIATHFDPY